MDSTSITDSGAVSPAFFFPSPKAKGTGPHDTSDPVTIDRQIKNAVSNVTLLNLFIIKHFPLLFPFTFVPECVNGYLICDYSC